MTTETHDVVALAEAAAQHPEILSGPRSQFLITPNGSSVREIPDDPHGLIVAPPARIVAGVTVQTTDSLVDYVERFKGENTILFADIAVNSIHAIIDYHGHEDPAHLSHSASLKLPFSEEWKTWTALSDKLMSQLDFARFLEENAVDVVAPTGAELLEVCRDLQAKRKVDFRKAVRTSTDNESFEYSEETTTTTKNGAIEIPTKFELRLPVYFGGASYTLFAFLRWKLDETQLSIGFKLHRAEHVRQAVFKEIVMDVAERTQRTAVFGRAA